MENSNPVILGVEPGSNTISPSSVKRRTNNGKTSDFPGNARFINMLYVYFTSFNSIEINRGFYQDSIIFSSTDQSFHIKAQLHSLSEFSSLTLIFIS